MEFPNLLLKSSTGIHLSFTAETQKFTLRWLFVDKSTPYSIQIQAVSGKEYTAPVWGTFINIGDGETSGRRHRTRAFHRALSTGSGIPLTPSAENETNETNNNFQLVRNAGNGCWVYAASGRVYVVFRLCQVLMKILFRAIVCHFCPNNEINTSLKLVNDLRYFFYSGTDGNKNNGKSRKKWEKASYWLTGSKMKCASPLPKPGYAPEIKG